VAKRAPRTGGGRHAHAPAPKKRQRRRVRAQRSSVLLRWCMLGVVGLVGVLYYQPLTTYFETRSTLN
jgi:cell division septal protein FtsQ